MPPDPASTRSNSATTMFNALQKHNARTVLGLKKIDGVIEIESNAKPIDAANLLWKHNLLAVPVWDAAEQKYVGFFDMRDILSAVIAAHSSSASGEYDTLLVKALEDVKVGDKKASLGDLASANPVYSCTPNSPLDKLCELLSEPECRRVLVCVKEGTRCFNMISRSTLVRYLSNTIPRNDLEATLDKAGLDYRKNVVSIQDTACAREAFQLMESKGLYGIAVVDEDGTLVGNTSARDIKLVALGKGCDAMDLDILSYLSAVRQDDSPLGGKKTKYPACHVREGSTVGHALNLLAKTGYHRVFVTDQYIRPVGVISDMDILGFIAKKSKELPHDLPLVPE